jgi:Cu(I)/Ag(I) efflux system membrane fusion protein
MNEYPFGRPATTPRGRALRWTAAILVLAVTAFGAYRFTRGATEEQPATADAMAGMAGMAGMPGMEPADSSDRVVNLTKEEQQRIGVTFAIAREGNLSHEIRTVAQVTFDETRLAVVSLKVDGWVEELFVNATGQTVRRGDSLFSIYSPQLVTAQQELLLAGQLASDVNTGSAAARSGATDLRTAARARLRQWNVPPEEIQAAERDGVPRHALVFTSPVTGIVVAKSIVQGQRVMAGDVLYRIADLSTVWLDGEVYEQDLPDVHLGQEVTAEFPALPGASRHGRISYIYPTLNTETRTAHVRVELANPGLELKPGMYATIRFVSASHRALTIPRSSVLATGERNLVFVRDADGRLVAREIVMGKTAADKVEVLRGLQAGEAVVASGTFLVDAESNLDKALGGMGDMPGMSVKPAGKAPPAPPTGGHDDR